MNIKRVDLIQQLVEKHGYTKKAATSVVDDFTDIIIENMKSGNSVSIHNFGCFDILERKERSCPHPVSGEKQIIPAHWVPKFYPSRGMKIAVKIWEDNDKRGLA